jgi:hypothetical protein
MNNGDGLAMSVWIILAILVLLFIRIYKNKKRSQPEDKLVATPYIYARKKYIMSKAEHNFFGLLNNAVGEKYFVFPQVRMSSLMEPRVHGRTWMGALGAINQKSVDFVLCEKQYCSPILAIELDDWSHDEEKRIIRDKNVEAVFASAGLPLLRFRDVRELTVHDIESQIAQYTR